MTGFAEYAHALASLGGIALLTLLMAPLSAVKKAGSGLAPGGTPVQDFGDAGYRWHRAHQNLAENIAPFAAAVLAAMLTGANPFWVNLLASLFLVVRVLLAVVHVRAIGKTDNGPRSILFILGWVICTVLAVQAILAAFSMEAS